VKRLQNITILHLKVSFSAVFICIIILPAIGFCKLSKEWFKLLHYKSNLIGNIESQVDGPNFFIHSNGKFQPDSEWVANLKAASDSTDLSENSYRCKFPARYNWLLKENLIVPTETEPECTKYTEFIGEIGANSISLIFASNYMNNPTSAFGHVYLKLHKAPKDSMPKSAGVSDYVINFGADITGIFIVKAIWQGFTGQFKGVYSTVPHDVNLMKYTYLENRNQWLLPLNFSEVELKRLVDHLWEMKSTHFNYYFLSENCAYHLRTLLEASKFDLDLKEKFVYTPHLFLTHLAESPGLVKEEIYLPSNNSVMNYLYDKLSTKEKGAVRKSLVENYSTDMEQMPDASKIKILDVLIQKHQYENWYIDLNDSLGKSVSLNLLSERMKLGPSTDIKYEPELSPVHGSKLSSIDIEGDYTVHQSKKIRLKYRPFFHSKLDNDVGFARNFDFRTLESEVYYNVDRNQLYFERFTLLNVFNFNPSSQLKKDLSWIANLNVFRNNPFFKYKYMGNRFYWRRRSVIFHF